MYSFGRDFDERLEIENIFREYIEKNNDFMDGAANASSDDGLDVQRNVFELVSSKFFPFAQAAVNGIEAAGYLDMDNASNERLMDAAARDACDAAFGFYGQFEEYRELMRALSARRFLVEKICSEMITVEFLYRINCI